ncbi:MAG: Bacterial dnaA protein helix-turn-helix [Candidatus Magasanikbacteria bacterium]|nr:Bacterial dnaA protein helix-turn-helix [Candidatus Magasanikbacteria bacterium]
MDTIHDTFLEKSPELQTTAEINATRAVIAERIINVAADIFHISAADLFGRRIKRDVTRPRAIVMGALAAYAALTYAEIGKLFGGRHVMLVQVIIKRFCAAADKDCVLGALSSRLHFYLQNALKSVEQHLPVNVNGRMSEWRPLSVIAKKIPLNEELVRKRISRSKIPFRWWRGKRGNIYPAYRPEDVMELCADRFDPSLVQTGEQGLCTIRGEKWGTSGAVTRKICGDDRNGCIKHRLKSIPIPRRRGKDRTGRIVTLYLLQAAIAFFRNPANRRQR